jgi:hypothetical protein
MLHYQNRHAQAGRKLGDQLAERLRSTGGNTNSQNTEIGTAPHGPIERRDLSGLGQWRRRRGSGREELTNFGNEFAAQARQRLV